MNLIDDIVDAKPELIPVFSNHQEEMRNLLKLNKELYEEIKLKLTNSIDKYENNLNM